MSGKSPKNEIDEDGEGEEEDTLAILARARARLGQTATTSTGSLVKIGINSLEKTPRQSNETPGGSELIPASTPAAPLSLADAMRKAREQRMLAETTTTGAVTATVSGADSAHPVQHESKGDEYGDVSSSSGVKRRREDEREDTEERESAAEVHDEDSEEEMEGEVDEGEKGDQLDGKEADTCANVDADAYLPSDFFDEEVAKVASAGEDGDESPASSSASSASTSASALASASSGGGPRTAPLPGTEHMSAGLQAMLKANRKLYKDLKRTGQLATFGGSAAPAGAAAASAAVGAAGGAADVGELDAADLAMREAVARSAPAFVQVDQAELTRLTAAERLQAEHDEQWRIRPVTGVEVTMWDAAKGAMVTTTESSKLQKRKHQMSQLAAQAKAMEGRVALMQANQARGRVAKMQRHGV